MIISGIIAEYDPFHNGHAYHIRRTREITGCDYVICVMSGSFTQRGEPACLSKWARAEAALENGADAVFELPALYAVRTADAFARSGAYLLSALGANYISFGCETDDMSVIKRVAASETPQVSRLIRENLDKGMSYPKARGRAFTEAEGLDINSPNLVLAAEYMRAIHALKLPITPIAVKRIGDYHSKELTEYASASAIRKAARDGRLNEALLPEATRKYSRLICFGHGMDDMLLYALNSMTAEDISALPDVSEGLERLLKKHAKVASSREELLSLIKSKRYTRARLSRLLTHALIGLTGELCRAYPLPEHARLIGLRADARPLISEISRRARGVLLIKNARELRGNPCFMLEERATDAWALTRNAPEERARGQERTRKFVTV